MPNSWIFSHILIIFLFICLKISDFPVESLKRAILSTQQSLGESAESMLEYFCTSQDYIPLDRNVNESTNKTLTWQFR